MQKNNSRIVVGMIALLLGRCFTSHDIWIMELMALFLLIAFNSEEIWDSFKRLVIHHRSRVVVMAGSGGRSTTRVRSNRGAVRIAFAIGMIAGITAFLLHALRSSLK